MVGDGKSADCNYWSGFCCGLQRTVLRVRRVDGGGSKTLQIYDPSTQSWSLGPPMNMYLDWAAGAALPDGRVLAIGGQTTQSDTSEVQAFDPSTGSWTTLAPLPDQCSAMGAVTGEGGEVYVMGGSCQDSGYTSQLLIYNPSDNAWTNGPSMPSAIAFPEVALGSDGDIYVVGGSEYSEEVSGGFAYNPVSRSWSTLPATPDPNAAGRRPLPPTGSSSSEA